MNISSLVVNLIDKNGLNLAIENLNKIENCEVIAHQNSQIVVVLECKSFDEQIKTFKKIESLENVKEACVVYSYEDSDLSLKQDFIDEVLNKELKAGVIKYSGNVKV